MSKSDVRHTGTVDTPRPHLTGDDTNGIHYAIYLWKGWWDLLRKYVGVWFLGGGWHLESWMTSGRSQISTISGELDAEEQPKSRCMAEMRRLLWKNLLCCVWSQWLVLPHMLLSLSLLLDSKIAFHIVMASKSRPSKCQNTYRPKFNTTGIIFSWFSTRVHNAMDLRRIAEIWCPHQVTAWMPTGCYYNNMLHHGVLDILQYSEV